MIIISGGFFLHFTKEGTALKTRVISAAVLIILVVGCFVIGPATRALLLLAAAIMAIWETCRAIGCKNVNCCAWILYAYTVLSVAAIWLGADAAVFEILLFVAVFACMTVGVTSKTVRAPGALATLGVIAYPVVPFLIITKLALADSSVWIPVFVVACISTWVCDSFALFGGKRFGKHKLSPEVSPNKTVEGSVCGAVSAVIASVIVYFALSNLYGVSLIGCMVTALICSTFGQIGDLAASLIKRMAGLKDYSNLIPGHGGVMDRVDSLLFSIPSAYFCLMIFDKGIVLLGGV